MPEPMPEEEAVARARAAGLEPLETYPGRGGDKWRMRCQSCGKEHRKTASNIVPCEHRNQHVASRAEQLLREAGFEALEPFPGQMILPWRMRCLTCGMEHRKISQVIKPCEHRLPAVSAAEQRVRSLGYEPLEPYSGRATDLWLMKCTTCGRTYRRRPQVKLAACRHTG